MAWGYNGWDGAEAGMPMSPDIANAGSNAVKTVSDNWNSMKTASPVAISFKNTDTKHGNPYFSLNYVDKDGLVDFGNSTAANLDPLTVSRAWAGQNLSTAQNAQIFNKAADGKTVSSKMKLVNNKYVLDTDNKATFDGGYMQATGNVPIQAAVAGSKSTVDAVMAGDWAVMVRVEVAEGIDAKAFAASIAWDKSYYYLTVDSISFIFSGAKVSINFPMQFDHHVYLDPKRPQTFYLKVKAIPFWLNQKATVDGHWTGLPLISTWVPTVYGYNQLQLQNGNADYVDYLHNRQIDASSQKAFTLDKIGPNSNTAGSYGEVAFDLNDSQLITKDAAGNIQPKFPKVQTPENSTGTLWSLYDLIPPTAPYKSPVYETGQTGQMISLINSVSGNETSYRDSGSSIYSWLLNSLSSYFGSNPFKGSAHINFSFDMSNYTAGKSKDQQALTAGRFFSAPNADGTFNMGDGTASTSAIRITMYDSSQLIDPYSLTKGTGLERTHSDEKNAINAADSLLRKTLRVVQSDQTGQFNQAGMTPADYAVIDVNQLDKGLTYPTYTNFTSWTGAIVPYDRMHWADTAGAAESTTFTDTLHSQGRFGTDLHYRTATPDPAQHGVLVNDGAAFSVAQRAAFLTDYVQNYAPIFDSTNPAKLTTGGVIKPQRYANVYSLYQYDATGKGTLPADNEPIANYTTTGNALSVKVSADTNAALNSKFITSSLNNKSWRYTGTMNTLPLAEATIKLTQPLNPQITLNGQSPYVVTDAQLAGAGVTKALGTWRDPLGIAAQDNLQTSLATPAVKQTANWNSISGLDTRTHALAVNVAKNTTAASVTPGLGGDSLAATLNYQMPTPTDQSNRVYYGEINLTRQATVPLKQDYLLDAKADFNKASANYLIFRNADAPDTAQYQVKKYFNTTGQPTTHRVSTVDINQDVPVKAEAAMLATGPVNTSKTLTIWIPKVAGTTIAKVPVVTASDGTVATVTDTTSSQLASVQQAYYTYSAVFAKAPANFAYTYAYHVGASNVAASAYKQKLVDFVMTGTQILGQSNAIQFDLLRGVNLLAVPTLDFGKNPAPTAGAVYPLTAASKANAYFEIMENDGNTKKNTYTWFLSAVMNPFRTAANQTGYGTFSVALGSPTRDAAGAVPDSAPTDLWYANHQPNPMVANGTSSAQLYYVNPMVESDTAAADVSSIKRFYPNAQLTVPAGVTITPGQYQSTVIYTVNDNSGSL